ncbi:hypothetical protein IQ243_11350 [Nostocales cyanobacterium LEGE 11386]|nr:hypothetical protein [Nostocales cyanobacterium LEGE 11386]
MAVSIFFDTNGESSNPEVILDEEIYQEIVFLADKMNISPSEVLAQAIECLRTTQTITEKLEKQLLEILSDVIT